MEEQVTPKKGKRTLLIAGIAVLLAAAIGGYYWQQGAAFETTDNAQLDGDILPVRAEVSARVAHIRFTDNQEVHQGDTLMVLDTTELQVKVLQATAALEQARANVSVSDRRAAASEENAQASYQNAASNQQGIASATALLTRARQDYKRMTELLTLKAATQEQVDHAKSALDVAAADYEKAVNLRQSALSTSTGLVVQAKAEQGQISASQALVKQRIAELQQAQLQLARAYIIAPLNGIVTKRMVQTGQYVSAGASLCTVIDQEHLWVTANFKETQLSKLKPGQPVTIKIDAYPGLSLSGSIASYGGATGAKFSLIPPDNASGNFIKITQRFPIRITLNALPKNKPTVLFAGLSAFVKVKTN